MRITTATAKRWLLTALFSVLLPAMGGGIALAAISGGAPSPTRPAATTTQPQHCQDPASARERSGYQPGRYSHRWCGGDGYCHGGYGWCGNGWPGNPRHTGSYQGQPTTGYPGGYQQGGWGSGWNGRLSQQGGWGGGGGSGCCGW